VIAVLGVGGVGGLVAARTGAVCVGTERTVAAIRERGLTLGQDGVTTVTRHEAVTRLECVVSLLVVAVKAYDLERALERVSPEALGGAVVLPLLNGLEHVELIRASTVVAHARAATVAGSIGNVEASSPEPGVVEVGAASPRIRAASDVLDAGTLARSLAPLRVPGIELDVGGDERGVLWEKAVRLAALAAATTASGLPIGALRDDTAWRDRLERAVAEACEVAAADGVRLAPAGQWAIIDGLPHDLTTSTARDARAGRPTELDAIAGSVVRAGERLGVPTPALTGLLKEATCRAP
jgi:2-dehydropantoate 2-reductase